MGKPQIQSRISISLFLLGFVASEPLGADELKLDASALFSRGVSQHLCLTADGAAIELQRGVLFEDDGPAAGYSYQPNEEKLAPGTWIKKELVIPAPAATQATLLVGRGGDLAARINGNPVAIHPVGKQGNYWQVYRFSPDTLRAGKNEFVLGGTGSVWIARDDEYAAGSLTRRQHPNRSAKSLDDGKTWNDTRLGTQNNVDGEYYIRVFLDQFHDRGRLTLNVMDVGNLSGRPIGPPVADVGTVRVQTDVATSSADSIEIRVRTGTTFIPSDETWSDWSVIELPNGVIAKPRGRYLQVDIILATDDPLTSPQMNSLTISATPARPSDWTKDLRVVDFDNQQIVRSSIPFQHETFDRPELAELRSKYQLDKVVAGADSEFELIQRLAAWSATRWQRMHLKESYPPYNALEILKPYADGTPVGGFCQQYNIVFLQACESFGLVGRLVSIGPGNMTDKIRGGHETVEIWSNELRKWVYVDGNTAWYAVDRKTEVPLSLWELRQRQLAAFRGEEFPPIKVVVLAETKYEWPDLEHWPPLVELRLIPRSNFLEQTSPLPLNQGMRGWFWTGHYVWTDDAAPARLLYSHRIANRDNFEWTLNQAQLVFEATNEPGKLRVHVDTETPGFAAFVASVDGTMESTIENSFHWNLHKGENTLRVAPRNTTGRIGIPSSVELLMEQ